MRGDESECRTIFLVVVKTKQALPKTALSVAYLIARKVGSNPEKPGFEAGFATKAGEALIDTKKTLLREGVGLIGIPQKHEQEAVNPALMAADDFIEVVRGQGSGWSAECRCQCRIHARVICGCYYHGRISGLEVYTESFQLSALSFH